MTQVGCSVSVKLVPLFISAVLLVASKHFDRACLGSAPVWNVFVSFAFKTRSSGGEFVEFLTVLVNLEAWCKHSNVTTDSSQSCPW